MKQIPVCILCDWLISNSTSKGNVERWMPKDSHYARNTKHGYKSSRKIRIHTMCNVYKSYKMLSTLLSNSATVFLFCFVFVFSCTLTCFNVNPQGITFKDYLDFFCFMRNISEADMALSFHNAAGKAIDPGNIQVISNLP